MDETNLSNPAGETQSEAPNDTSVEPAQVQPEGSQALSMDDLHRIDETGRDATDGGTADVGTRGEVEPAGVEEPPEGFDLLTSDLAVDETFDLDGFYKGIKPEHLEKLDPLSKQVIHNLRRDYHNKRQRDAQTAKDQSTVYGQRESDLRNQERQFLAKQQAFASLLDDPRIKAALETPEGELPDVLSPEGIEARIERAAAEKISQFVAPVREAAEYEAKRVALEDFVSSHPEMKSVGFREEVRQLMEDRSRIGYAISTPDAYEIVKSQKQAVEVEKSRARERQVRAAAARQIGKGKGNATASSGPPKGARAHELFAWAKANPEEAARIAGLK